MKKKSDVAWCSRTLLNNPYYIGICKSEKSFRSELKRLKIPEGDAFPWISDGADATTHEIVNKKERRKCCIICVSNTKGKSRSEISTLLVHEAVHVWQKIKKDYGEEEPGNEMEAYCIQAISLSLITGYYGDKSAK